MRFSELTVGAAVPSKPFPFGAVGGSDDAHNVTVLDRQIVLASFCCYGYFCLVHGILLSCNLTNTVNRLKPHIYIDGVSSFGFINVNWKSVSSVL